MSQSHKVKNFTRVFCRGTISGPLAASDRIVIFPGTFFFRNVVAFLRR